ncbi:hypothetical protein IscW_ISCW006414 [Ixodes scapularis]|uniref:Uncharacterized protein n=1 Tax=Ixodes scapularis TaxID=6945 RepID=B7PLU0_IXOSC|nr:hypothetical protein IscW_ISCW006414 [Ixodes scapularis]|eukprot:XP_002434738.1 hypothetical protein IscW_ISCW006414 [Ixodes scapularis]
MEAVSAKDTGRAPSARTLAALALAAAALLLVGLVVGLLLYAHWLLQERRATPPFFALPGNIARLP